MAEATATTTDAQAKQQNLSSLKKDELIQLVKQHRTNEEMLRQIEELRDEIKTIKEMLKEMTTFNPHRNINRRMIDIERRLAEQEQYTRRECVEIVGLPQDINGEDLENHVVKTFDAAGVQVTRRSFHAIHRLRDRKIVIAKLVNRRDTIKILKNKKKLRNLNNDNKKKLNAQKIYVNESLCRPYRQLLGKCNALFKKKQLTSFYTVNGKLKIVYDNDNTEEVAVISHVQDLYDIFDEEVMAEIQQQ